MGCISGELIMLMRLERNPSCKKSAYMDGMDENGPPPDWFEVLSIHPNKVVKYEEKHLQHVQRIDCQCFCMGSQGFFVVDTLTISNLIGDGEYSLVGAGSDPNRYKKAKTKQKKGPRKAPSHEG